MKQSMNLSGQQCENRRRGSSGHAPRPVTSPHTHPEQHKSSFPHENCRSSLPNRKPTPELSQPSTVTVMTRGLTVLTEL